MFFREPPQTINTLARVNKAQRGNQDMLKEFGAPMYIFYLPLSETKKKINYISILKVQTETPEAAERKRLYVASNLIRKLVYINSPLKVLSFCFRYIFNE